VLVRPGLGPHDNVLPPRQFPFSPHLPHFKTMERAMDRAWSPISTWQKTAVSERLGRFGIV
jgi:hypothetical protein